jgi:uncharacterized membrane protein YphA (DoxX/SURF4 family)
MGSIAPYSSRHICIMGGLFVLAGAGPGAFALDNLRR